MRRPHRIVRAWLSGFCLLIVASAAFSSALTDPELFELQARFVNDADVVPRQLVKLEIETATSGWFSQGTRIKVPEVPGLIILQQEKFAANASERRANGTWVIQRWSLDIYALQAGTFRIPPIAVTVGVTDSSQQTATGTVFTPPVSLTVTLPPALSNLTEWVASTQFDVQQHFDRLPDTLTVGDAIQQRVEIVSNDVPAMMLPVFTPPERAGLAAYPEPPRLTSQTNRGVATASRTTVVSYVIESPGQYVLPASDYYWWDTRNGELNVVTLPSVTLNALAGTKGQSGAFGLSASVRTTVIVALLTTAALLGVVYLAVAARRSRTKYLAPIHAALMRLYEGWQRLVKPALPDKLNP